MAMDKIEPIIPPLLVSLRQFLIYIYIISLGRRRSMVNQDCTKLKREQAGTNIKFNILRTMPQLVLRESVRNTEIVT